MTVDYNQLIVTENKTWSHTFDDYISYSINYYILWYRQFVWLIINIWIEILQWDFKLYEEWEPPPINLFSFDIESWTFDVRR